MITKSIKKINVVLYETSDKKRFEDPKDAGNHEAKLIVLDKFRDLLCENLTSDESAIFEKIIHNNFIRIVNMFAVYEKSIQD